MKMIHQSKLHILSVVFATLFLISCNSGSTTNNQESTEGSTKEVSSDFQISLAQWSLHKTFFGGEIEDWGMFGRMLYESPDSLLKGEKDPIDFPEIAASYGIYSIELVNTLYFSKVGDEAYWAAFKEKCDKAGVSVGLIMCDLVGELGNADADARMAAVEGHYKWVDLAQFLGAHSIRVNAGGQGTPEELAANAIDGLSKLGEYGAMKGINILVENHGGYSSDGKWLSGVISEVGMDNVGTLPDFGNFCINGSNNPKDECQEMYDRYVGLEELMPFAKGVSAKSHKFDEDGNEVYSDYLRLMKIVKESGFKGYVGIEYEGDNEDEGIKATKALLEKAFKEI
jgi:sugar phosphate isomerase/epimerase